MFKKLLNLIVFVVALLFIVAPIASAAPALQNGEVTCAETYTVQAEDWLSKLAERYFGDAQLYTAIVAATNQMQASDSSFAQIDNPDRIEPGWKLCIVDKAATAALSGESTGAMAAANFTETKVTLENGIAGIVARPNGVDKGPAVLMLHGFGSQKDEVGDMYKRAAATLADKGIASLRIDFRGWGESAGDMADSTVQGQVDDAQTAYNYLAAQDFVDPSRVGILGFSLGGGVSVISGAQHPDWYKSMVVWSSVGDFKPDFIPSLGQENFDKAAAEGIVTIDLGWRSVTLKDNFFKSLETYNLQDEIKKYPGAFLAIAGSEDFSAAYVDSFVAGASGQTKEKWVIPGGDHIYGVLGEDQTMANSVIQKTADWFSQTLP
ncbi:MAG: alpha/beta fold hydrolase [Anaerolineae bacterium]